MNLMRKHLRLTQLQLATAWSVDVRTIRRNERRAGWPVSALLRPLVVYTCRTIADAAYGPPEAPASSFVRPSDIDPAVVAAALDATA